MNSLSLLLYVADIVGNLQGLFAILTIVSTFLSIAGWIATLLGDDGYNKQEKLLGEKLSNSWKFALTFACLLAVFPQKETIYLIAGSEAGEAVVNSQEGKEILSNINEVIKHQLNQLKGETK